MQMPENNHDREEPALEAPARLISALKRSPKATLYIPPTVDGAILHAARRHLLRPTERRFKWTLLLRLGLGVTAMVLLLAVIPPVSRKFGSGFSQGDLNHDGKVDILDAFALARELRTGVRPTPQMDLNGDGVVDERDVATLAAQAVSLGKGGRS